MAKNTFLFDLDLTLVDTSALTNLRLFGLWAQVKQSLHLAKSFPTTPSPVDVANGLYDVGWKIGVVTSSPRDYAQQLLTMFGVKHHCLVAYHDTTEHKPQAAPLLKALELLGTEAADAYYVGDEPNDVEASHNAGVTSVGAGWNPPSLSKLVSVAPDIFLQEPVWLGNAGLAGTPYVGELAFGTGPPTLHWGSVLRCGGDPPAFALGRYFTKADARCADSELSTEILVLKNDDAPAAVFGKAVAAGIRVLGWCGPALLVPVPPKPSQTRQRFAKVLDVAAAELGGPFQVLHDGLHMVKEVDDYKAKNPGERASAVAGAFATRYDWRGVAVVLVDDVLTTGATTDECTRVLRGAGAVSVQVLGLGRDQKPLAKKICPACERPLKVKTNGRTGETFWGCKWPVCRYSEDF